MYRKDGIALRRSTPLQTPEQQKESARKSRAKYKENKAEVLVYKELRVAYEAIVRPGGQGFGAWLEGLGMDALVLLRASAAVAAATFGNAERDHQKARERQILVEKANPRINSECPHVCCNSECCLTLCENSIITRAYNELIFYL
jgi:hypothetical protein